MDDETEVIVNLMGADITTGSVRKVANIINDVREERKKSLFRAALEDWFESSDYYSELEEWPKYMSNVMRYCLVKYIDEKFETDRCTNYKEDHYNIDPKEVPPRYATFALTDKESYSIPHTAYYFLTDKETNEDGKHERWVVEVGQDFDGTYLDVYNTIGLDEIASFFEDFKEYIYANNPLRGRCFNGNLEVIQQNESVWDDIILDKATHTTIEDNLLAYVENIDLFNAADLPTSRGIILAGPPGTGKTLLVNVLLNHFDEITRVYITPDNVTQRGQLAELYKMARKLGPSLVILEDIDTVGGESREDSHSPLLGELLSSLNSVEENSGVITIATTNFPFNLDIALRDRPGRFDVRIDFDFPELEMRKSILQKYSGAFDTTSVDWDDVARPLDKYTGAWLRELVIRAANVSMRRHKVENPSDLILTADDFSEATSAVRKTREQVNSLGNKSADNGWN